MLGMVGWPIALAAVGGALMGRFLDRRYGTGVHFTLMLLTAGAMIGSYTAWRALKGRI
jgi:ATP synthase protein I